MTDFKHALDSLMTTGDLEGYSVNEYLEQLLLKLWTEGESFRGKSPFGNSGWQSDLIVSLVISGDIRGTVDRDDDGYINETTYDTREANKYILGMISSVFAEQLN